MSLPKEFYSLEIEKLYEAFVIAIDALEKIEGYHGRDEDGVCGSLRMAKEALSRISELGNEK